MAGACKSKPLIIKFNFIRMSSSSSCKNNNVMAGINLEDDLKKIVLMLQFCLLVRKY